MGISPIAGNAGKAAPLPPPQNNANQIVKEQIDQLINLGFFGKKNAPKMMSKMPHHPVVPKQAQMNLLLHAYVANVVKAIKTDKTKKADKTHKEELDEVFKGMEECLDEISKIPLPVKNNQFHPSDHLDIFLTNAEEQFEELKKHNASDELLQEYLFRMYDLLSSPKYNQGEFLVLEHLFKIQKGVRASYFKAELMFNYVVELVYIYTKDTEMDILRPFKAIKDSLVPFSDGLPDIELKLNTLDDQYKEQLLSKIVYWCEEFPFSSVLPVFFGNKGKAILKQWATQFWLKDETQHSKISILKRVFKL